MRTVLAKLIHTIGKFDVVQPYLKIGRHTAARTCLNPCDQCALLSRYILRIDLERTSRMLIDLHVVSISCLRSGHRDAMLHALGNEVFHAASTNAIPSAAPNPTGPRLGRRHLLKQSQSRGRRRNDETLGRVEYPGIDETGFRRH